MIFREPRLTLVPDEGFERRPTDYESVNVHRLTQSAPFLVVYKGFRDFYCLLRSI